MYVSSILQLLMPRRRRQLLLLMLLLLLQRLRWSRIALHLLVVANGAAAERFRFSTQ